MAARIYACFLAASLIAVDALPVFAATGPGEPAVDKIHAMEEDVSDKEILSMEGTEAGDAIGPEEDSPGPQVAPEEGTGSQDGRKDPQNAPTGEVQRTPGSQPEPGLFDGTEPRQELFSIPEQKEGQETASGLQENSDGLLYLNGTPYSGYYMDSAGILYVVANGTAEPKTGAVAAGTEYYSVSANGKMTLQKQAFFVEGKAYAGYYMDSSGTLYTVANGAAEAKTGMVGAGTEYYSYPARKVMALTAQTVFVAGKLYTGYCRDSAGILYVAANGIAEPETGTVDAGAEYYNFSSNKTEVLPAQALFVEGKLYTGYYLGPDKKLYYAKKGRCSLKTGAVKAGTNYYSYRAKKFLQLKKQTLYVKGKVYTGYYMGQSKNMYRVKNGTRTLITGTVKAGAKYYSYRAKKFLKLKKQTLYVKGKVYTGFYMGKPGNMYDVKNGTRTLVTGMLEAGTKYYSYNAKKARKLPRQALYVRGKIYSGYYLDPEDKMNSVSEGTCTLVNTALNAGTKYYSYHAKRTLSLPQMTVYVYGKAMEGMSPESLATLQRAQAVVASITNEGMAKEEKLRACFEFVKTYRGGRPRIPNYTGMDWPVVYANDMFVNDGKGNCFSYAAAFAYMAKAIGYEEVYACHGGGHGWAEVDGLIYDPERNKFDPSFHYYGVSYDEKTKVDYKGSIAAGQPWMHVKI